MGETLEQKLERYVSSIDEPFNFRNVLLGTMERVYHAAGDPHAMPDLDPAAFHRSIAAFVSGTVEKLGLGLIIRVVVPHDARFWRELYKATIFLDEDRGCYVVQFFEKQTILAIVRVTEESVDWGAGLPEGTQQEAVFYGFLLGLSRGVPPRGPALPRAPIEDDPTALQA